MQRNQIIMNAKPILARPLGIAIVASTLSFLATIGLFTAVAGLFLRDGTPLQNVAIAERACSELAFVCEREACVRSFLAAAYDRRVASR
jgi:hypothetical protein